MQSSSVASTTSNHDDEIVLVRIAQRFPCGSPEYVKAIGELLAASQKKIKHFAFMFDKNRDSDDIVQEVSLRIFERLHQLQEPSYYSTWIYRVTANACLGERRKRRARPVILIDDVIHSSRKTDDMGTSIPDLAANFADLSNDWEKRVILGMYFVRLFEVLSEEEKTLVELYYLERLSTEVMAELMDITVPAFKSKILRIRRRLEAQTEYLDQPPKGDRRQKLAGLFSGTAAER